MQTIKDMKTKEKIFILCDRCLWTATCLNKKYLEELSVISDTEYSCPSCKQEELSSFPIAQNDCIRYSYSKRRGLESLLEDDLDIEYVTGSATIAPIDAYAA